MVPSTQEGKSIEINSQLFGQYNIDNLVNVIKVSDYFGLVPKQIKMGIEGYFPANNRSQLIEDDNNNTIILDAYNANPSSVELALDHFTGLETDNKKVIILGDMLELGEIEEIEHLTVVNHLMSYPEIICIFVGPAFATASSKIDQNCDHFQFFNLTAEAKEWWNNSGLKKSLVLVKGSRGIALEKIFKE